MKILRLLTFNNLVLLLKALVSENPIKIVKNVYLRFKNDSTNVSKIKVPSKTAKEKQTVSKKVSKVPAKKATKKVVKKPVKKAAKKVAPPKPFDYKLHIDLVSSASNMLIIQGWAFCVKTKIKRIEIFYEDNSKNAIIGLNRPDVIKVFKECDYLDSGFYFQQYLDYTSDSREVKIKIYGENGKVFIHIYKIPKIIWFPNDETANKNKFYKKFFRTNSLSFQHIKALQSIQKNFDYQPLISIIVPVYNVDVKWMEIAIESITSQVYTNWELLLIDDCSTSEELIEYLKEINHPQIKVHFSKENGHISKATNIGISLAKGEFVLFMDNDDKIDVTALYEVVHALNKNPSIEILYSDEDKINTEEVRYSPVFKPDWSPELILTTNYFNHLLVVKKELCEKVKFRSEFDGCQDWDFILRLLELSNKVHHIPKVLYNWRTLEGSISRGGEAKEDMSFLTKCQQAISLHLSRNNINATASRPQFAVDKGVALFEINSSEKELKDVSIVLKLSSSNDKKKLLYSLIDSISSNSEIIICHSNSTKQLEKIFSSKNFNKYKFLKSDDRKLSETYNAAAKKASNENLLFIDENIESISKQVLLNLQLFSKQEKMGVVGSKLLLDEKTIYSSGYIVGLSDTDFLVPSKAFHKEENSNGYFFFKQIMRNYSAIQKELFFVKKQIFNELNGFDEKAFGDTLFDVDFCLRASKNGYRHLSLPGDTIIKLDAEKEDKFNLNDLQSYNERYSKIEDPYYNANFSKFKQFDYKIQNNPTKGIKKNDLRILFCTHNLNFEGAPIHIYEIVEHLMNDKNLNFDIEIYAPLDGPLKEKYESLGVKVNLLPSIATTDSIRSDVHFERNMIRIAKWLSDNAFDSIFCNTVLSYDFIMAADIVSIPAIWNIHESTPYNAFFRNKKIDINSKLKEAFSTVSDIIFSSKNTSDLYKSYIHRNNFRIISNGIKENEIAKFKEENSKKAVRKKLGIDENNLVFLSLGTFCARKGQIDFVQAAVEMLKQHPNPETLTFILVGAEKSPSHFSYTSHITTLVGKSDFKDRFMVLPVQPNINDFYRASDIFVCSSYNESSPRVILIAMLFDLPIITTPVYGIKEQVVVDENSLYYTPGDIEVLQHNMEALDNDRKLLDKFAKNSEVVLNLSNSHQQMIDAYVDVIENVN